jgi:hypothetical protein
MDKWVVIAISRHLSISVGTLHLLARKEPRAISRRWAAANIWSIASSDSLLGAAELI